MTLANSIKKHPHLAACICIVVLTLLVFHPWLTTLHSTDGDIANEYIPFFAYMEEAAFEHNEIPRWIHKISSGTVFFAVGDKPVLYPLTIISLFFLDYALAFNLNVLFHVAFGGIGMYFLMLYLIRKPPYALISAIVFTFNYHMYRKMTKFWGVAWIPWIFLCFYLAINEEDIYKKIGFSILGAVGLAMQFHIGSIEIALFTIVMIVILSLYFLASKDFVVRLKTLLIVGIIMGSCFAGLIAIKLLPNYEFSLLTTRAQGISLEQAKGSYYDWLNFEFLDTYEEYLYAPRSFVINFTKGCQQGGCSSIGIIGTLLVLASLKFWRKKNVFFYWGLAIFGATMVTGSFMFEFFYNYVPGFNKLQHAARFGIVLVFALSILAGYGTMYLSEKYGKNWKAKKKHIIFAILIVLLVVDMAYVFSFNEVLQNYKFEDFEYKKVPIMLHLQDQYDPKYPFRIKAHDTYGRGSVAQYLTLPLGLDIIDGQYGGLWIPEYINEYLTLAQQHKTRMWGNLNAKYIIATQKHNYSNTELIGEFENCPDCFQPETTGPYLYENKEYLPRAFWTNSSILLVGQNTMQTGYYLLTHSNFNLSKQIIVMGDHEKISEYKLDELKRHSAIILLQGSVDQTFILEKYVEEGGTLIPNILEGQDSASEEDIVEILLKHNTSQIKELAVTMTPNSFTPEIKDLPQGFIVINERMYMFPGWEVSVDGKKILDGEKSRLSRTNMILSSFYLDKPAEEVLLTYSPDSYELGKKVSIITLLAILLFGLFFIWRRSKLKSQ